MTGMARARGAMPKPVKQLDLILLLAVACLIGFGIVMVSSASLHRGGRYGAPVTYLTKHLVARIAGVGPGVAKGGHPCHPIRGNEHQGRGRQSS